MSAVHATTAAAPLSRRAVSRLTGGLPVRQTRRHRTAAAWRGAIVASWVLLALAALLLARLPVV